MHKSTETSKIGDLTAIKAKTTRTTRRPSRRAPGWLPGAFLMIFFMFIAPLASADVIGAVSGEPQMYFTSGADCDFPIKDSEVLTAYENPTKSKEIG